jgi:replicative DNA helicase
VDEASQGHLPQQGVGKTTLVARVCKQVATTHFDCAAWVVVSQEFSLEDLLRRILRELRRDARGDGGNDYRSLVKAVRVTSLKFGGMLINKNVDLQFSMNHWSACQLKIRMSSTSLSFNP